MLAYLMGRSVQIFFGGIENQFGACPTTSVRLSELVGGSELAELGQIRTTSYNAWRLAQTGSLALGGTISHRQFWAPFRSFSTTGSPAKQSVKRAHKTALKHYLESVRDTESCESWENPVCSDEDRLNEEQRTVLDLVVKQGRSVFFTGPAGTGKSVLLKKIIRSLATKYLGESKRVGVTASTGLAAHNIGGTTLHRFAGIGLGQAPIEKLIRDILKTKIKLQRWLDADVLIIDEISMIDCALFDKLDAIARVVRTTNLPFGGIQLVLSGDFFQLPPVRKGSDDGSPKFCFESNTWNHAIQHTIGLTQIYRQRDPEFTAMLNQVREGCLSPLSIETFRKLHRPVADNSAEATELFPLRHEADRANSRRLQNINEVAYSYTARDGGIIINPDTRKMLLGDCIAPESLILKKGAQVMLIKNIDKALVNGSQGRIIGFTDRHSFLHHRWDDDNTHDSIKLPCAFDELMDERLPLYPVVRFAMRDGSTRVHLCEPAEWAVERWVPEPWVADGWVVEKLATRIQVPLLLAWALSIHKAQGQTLDRVKVDLDRVFETGQAYVALSRATSIGGLQVLNFDPNKVTVHPKVKAFYASMSNK
uniref:ATP-dependent DNA helicase PIF1 n=1 Tax=Bionectria ochroleuca TaxID=29856 RepID=A0A0B7KS61_BIOOC